MVLSLMEETNKISILFNTIVLSILYLELINVIGLVNGTTPGPNEFNDSNINENTNYVVYSSVYKLNPVVYGGGVTNITNCGSLAGNAYYSIINNINSSGNCIDILGDNVYINGNNHILTYANNTIVPLRDMYGITAQHHKNITIKNLTILEGNNISSSNVNRAISFININDSTLENLSITTQTYGSSGIFLHSASDNNKVINNKIVTSTIDADAVGIEISISTNETLIGNNITAPKAMDIMISASSGSQTQHVIGTSNYADGLPVYYNYLINNSVLDGLDYSAWGEVMFANANNLTISNSTFGTKNGLAIIYSNNTSVMHNNVNATTGTGIYLYHITNSSIQNNNVLAYGSSALFMRSNSDNNIIGNNIFSGIGQKSYGIYLYDYDTNNSIYNNNISSSGIDARGIYLDSGNKFNNISYNSITITPTTSRDSCGIMLFKNSSNNTINWNKINDLPTAGTGLAVEASSNHNNINNLTFINSQNPISVRTSYNVTFSDIVKSNFTINLSSVNNITIKRSGKLFGITNTYIDCSSDNCSHKLSNGTTTIDNYASSIMPSTGIIKVKVTTYSATLKQFNISGNTTAQVILCDNQGDTNQNIMVNGSFYAKLRSNATGCVDFTYALNNNSEVQLQMLPAPQVMPAPAISKAVPAITPLDTITYPDWVVGVGSASAIAAALYWAYLRRRNHQR